MRAKERPRNEEKKSGAFTLPVKAGALYFAVMFILGWVTGAVREVLFIPLLGLAIGTVIEAIILIGAMFVSLHGLNWLLGIPSGLSTRVIMGLVALGLLLPAEVLGARIFRGQSAIAFLFPSDLFYAAVQWGLLMLFAAMPLLVRRHWKLGDEISS